jgi:hypothetical protein
MCLVLQTIDYLNRKDSHLISRHNRLAIGKRLLRKKIELDLIIYNNTAKVILLAIKSTRNLT